MSRKGKLKIAIEDTEKEIADKEAEIIFLRRVLIKLKEVDKKKDNNNGRD